MAKLLKTLTKDYELDEENPNSYFEYIEESVANGQRRQARTLFSDMKREDKHDCINYLREEKTELTEDVLTLCIEELFINMK